MKRAASAVSLAFAVGCAAAPMYTIKSSVPAYVEVDGVIKCDQTPCTITLPRYVNAFGDCVSRSGGRPILTAYPISQSSGYVQQKLISPACNEKSTVFFDMGIAPAVQTIQTPQQQ